MNKSFIYNPIDSSRHEIRLVVLDPASEFSADIHCSLQHVSLSSAERSQYEALSYVWGDPSATKAIFLRGEAFQVTMNLESALRHLRFRTRERVLWVDAIAINQNDVKEREEQVAIMGLVYQSAQCGLLWMGGESAKYRYAMYVLGHRFSEDEKKAAAEFARLVRNKSSMWSHLVAFFEAPVWQRMWIVQELALAREVRVMCRFKELDWNSLRIVANILTSPRYVEQVPPSSAEGLVQVTSISSLRAWKPPADRPWGDLLLLWYAFGWATCHDPRDKIFAILNIVTDKLGIIPDYKIDADELFCSVARKYILQRRDFKILGYRCINWPTGATRSTLRVGSGAAYGPVPSWCPDFGSSLQPYSPRFFTRMADSPESWKGIPWTDRSSQLLNSSENPRQLILLGISLDIVTMVTESTASWPDSEVIDQYYNRVTSMLAGTFRPDDMYFNGDTMKRSYWVTICSGMARTNKDHWRVAPLGSKTELFSSEEEGDFPKPDVSTGKFIQATELDMAPTETVQVSDTEYQVEAEYQFKATLVETTQHHSFCMTEKGYMALVPDTTLPGDILCVLYGGCTPFVLRPTQGPTQSNAEGAIQALSQEEDLMELVGPAYAYGFMDGLPQQWLEEGIREERRFILV
jgi:hypothetical protein